MREIKFRLRIGNQIVGYERWNSLEGKWCYDSRPNGVFDIRNSFIPHTNKDHFTGLKDKNGKEYFANDIFLKQTTRHIVKWNEDYAGWYLYWADGGASMPFSKVIAESGNNIGNIYSNPELREV